MIDTGQLAGWSVAIVTTAAAIFERIRSIKKSDIAALSIAKDGLIEVLKADRDTHERRYNTEHDEFVSYRSKTDATAETVRIGLIKLAEETAVLKERTDVTPLFAFAKSQNIINERIILMLDHIVAKMAEHIGKCPLPPPEQLSKQVESLKSLI